MTLPFGMSSGFLFRYSVFKVQRQALMLAGAIMDLRTARQLRLEELRSSSSRIFFEYPPCWLIAAISEQARMAVISQHDSCSLHYRRGDGEIRTHDPLLARQVLSQLSYTPKRSEQTPLGRLFRDTAASCSPMPSPA